MKFVKKIIEAIRFLISLICGCNAKLVMGDLDNDGVITQNDVDIAIGISLGTINPTEYQMIVGDINQDGVINSADVALISRMIEK